MPGVRKGERVSVLEGGGCSAQERPPEGGTSGGTGVKNMEKPAGSRSGGRACLAEGTASAKGLGGGEPAGQRGWSTGSSGRGVALHTMERGTFFYVYVAFNQRGVWRNPPSQVGDASRCQNSASGWKRFLVSYC